MSEDLLPEQQPRLEGQLGEVALTQAESDEVGQRLISEELVSGLVQLTGSEFKEGVSDNGWEKVVYKRHEPGYKWHHTTLGDGSDNPDFSFVQHSHKHPAYAQRVNLNQREDGGFDIFIHKMPQGTPHYGGDRLRANVIDGSVYTRLRVGGDGVVTGERFDGETMFKSNVGYGSRSEISPPTEIRGVAPESHKSNITEGDVNGALSALNEITNDLTTNDTEKVSDSVHSGESAERITERKEYWTGILGHQPISDAYKERFDLDEEVSPETLIELEDELAASEPGPLNLTDKLKRTFIEDIRTGRASMWQ